MPIPQVNDRIKEAPMVVLRAVFAGIGQILLAADKVRARAAEQAWTPDRAPALGPSCQPAAPRLAPGPGNGTLHTGPAVTGPAVTGPAVAGPAVAEPLASREPPQSPGTAAQAAAPATETAQATKTARATTTAKAITTAKAAKATKAAKTVPAPRPGTAEPAAEAPPLPGYDDLSLASLRARLRVLDAAQIRAMLGYEKAHARREPVITMLERRLAKITAG